MGDIQIIVFVAIVAAVVLRQMSRGSKQAQSLPPEAPADVFPEIGEEVPAPRKPATHKRARYQQPVAAPKTSAAVSRTAPPRVVAKKMVRPRVRFSTPNDAAQAFILSEIFNRKY